MRALWQPSLPRYFCDGRATTPTQHPCGNNSVYCPAGSAAPTLAGPGVYTIGPSAMTRTDTVPCPGGSYCVNGISALCPAGRFGCADRLGDPDCNGPCTGGFYCPAGSTSSQAYVQSAQFWFWKRVNAFWSLATHAILLSSPPLRPVCQVPLWHTGQRCPHSVLPLGIVGATGGGHGKLQHP